MENANLWSIILFGDLFSINDYDNNDYETKEIYQKLLKTLNNTLINKVAELQFTKIYKIAWPNKTNKFDHSLQYPLFPMVSNVLSKLAYLGKTMQLQKPHIKFIHSFQCI